MVTPPLRDLVLQLRTHTAEGQLMGLVRLLFVVQTWAQKKGDWDGAQVNSTLDDFNDCFFNMCNPKSQPYLVPRYPAPQDTGFPSKKWSLPEITWPSHAFPWALEQASWPGHAFANCLPALPLLEPVPGTALCSKKPMRVTRWETTSAVSKSHHWKSEHWQLPSWEL